MFLRNLRQIVSTEGSANLIYLDESGFDGEGRCFASSLSNRHVEANTYRPYAWSERGHK